MNRKFGIRLKVIVFTHLVVSSIVIIGVGLGYFWGYNLLYSTISDSQSEVADIFVLHIKEMLDTNIRHFKRALVDPAYVDAVAKSNIHYQNMDAESIQECLADMDRQWIEAKDEGPLIREYLDNPAGMELKIKCEEDESLAEMFITDRFGALVASSGKTSDFYQADEMWWQSAFAKGLGEVFIGDVEFDKSSNRWSFPIALPIKDKNSVVIGVAKMVIDSGIFFNSINNFRVGKSGHAALTDKSGYIIFHKGVEPLSQKICSDSEFQKLLQGKGQEVIYDDISKEKVVVSSSVFKYATFQNDGLVWIVIISQDTKEAFAPVNKLIFKGIVLVLFLIVMTIPISIVFGGTMVKPLVKLQEAAKKIAKGSWDSRIEIKTGDEIEELAFFFNLMAQEVQNRIELMKKTEEILKRNNSELERQQKVMFSLLENINRSKKVLAEKTVELTRSNTELEQFASVASHDLREPLRMVSSYMQLLEKRYKGKLDSEADEFINFAADGARRMQALINDLLDYSRVTTKGKPFISVDCNAVLKCVLDNLKIGIQDTGAQITVDPLPKVMADETQMIQLFQNLVANAIKFRPKEPLRILISCRKKEKDWEFCVKDNGIGFQQQYADKIFQIFQRLHTQAEYSDTGIGLAIVKKIVERHGGIVWVESKVGKGSSFCFTIPERTGQNGG